MRYLGYVTLGEEGAAKRGATGPAEKTGVGAGVFKECQASCPLFPALEDWHPLCRARLTYIPGMQPSSPFWFNLQRVKAACTRLPHHPGNLGYSSVLGNVENKVPNNFSVPEPFAALASPPPKQGSTTVGVKSRGEGLCRWPVAGGAPRSAGSPRAGSSESAPSRSPPAGLWAQQARRAAGAPESWGRRKKVVSREAGGTHLAPSGMKS